MGSSVGHRHCVISSAGSQQEARRLTPRSNCTTSVSAKLESGSSGQGDEYGYGYGYGLQFETRNGG
ncbi:hypothetical protein PM082_024278 [Marasmius tenuissimus]|nr:hypothetical protein PM082_024278 [Marasmius tenuissimus]